MSDCKALGTLVVPLWKSAYYWPLLSKDGTHLNSFVSHSLYLPNRPDLFVRGKAKNKLFGTKAFKSRCLALRVDFARNVALLVLVFAPLRWAGVQLAILRRSVRRYVCYCYSLHPTYSPIGSTIAGTIVLMNFARLSCKTGGVASVLDY